MSEPDWMTMRKMVENPKQRVTAPKRSDGCWVEKRIPSGNRNRLYSEYWPCEKSARAGRLTCFHHDKWNSEAESLKWKYDFEKQRVENCKQVFKNQHGREMTAEELKNLGLGGK